MARTGRYKYGESPIAARKLIVECSTTSPSELEKAKLPATKPVYGR